MIKRLAVLPIPVFALAIVAAAILDVRGIYEPRWLLPMVNMVCLFIPGWIIAYVSVQGYLNSGSFPLLLFGSAAMVYGTGSGVGGWMIAVLGAVDAGIVLHNTMSAIGGILNLWSGLLVTRLMVASPSTSGRTKVLLLYAGLGGVVVGLSVASLRGLTPVFVLPGGGFTPVRELTLGIAVAGFVASALLFWKRYLDRQSDFLYWGTLALAMLSIGLSGLLLQRGVGTLVGWFSRSAQYVGSAYFLIAVVRAWRAAQRTNVPVAQAIASLFREAEANYRVLVETATDAIIAIDREGRVLLWNGAAERLFGYRRTGAVDGLLSDMIGLQAAIDRWTAYSIPPDHGNGVVRLENGLQAEVRRQDGSTFPAEVSVSARHTEAGWLGTVILRDVTERKRAADRLDRLNRDLRTLSLCNQVLVRSKDEGELLGEICRTLVEEGGQRAAWVGLVEEDDGFLRPIAVVGCEPERLDRHAMNLADPAWATCPVTLALRTGTPQVVQDIPGNPPRCPWHDEAVRLGIGSSISLPLKEGERSLGALTIYSAQSDGFSDEETKLLVELADDLTYGIQALRTRAAHDRALAEIESVARFPSENPNPILRVQADGTVLYANAPSGPLLRLWGTGVGGPMPSEFVAKIRKVLETRTAEIVELSCDDRVYSIGLTPIPQAGYVNLYGQDMTERQQAETALQASETRFRRLFESAKDGILLLNAASGEITDVNPFLLDLLGYVREDLLGKRLWDISPFRDIVANQKAFAELQAQGYVRYEHLPLETKGGKKVDVEFVSNVYRVNGAHVIQCNIRDITERKRLERERVGLEAQLRQQQKLESIGTLASGVAHEINNPLTGIMNYAQLIADTVASGSPAAAHAGEIIQETERVATIVRNLLQFARQEQQAHSPARMEDIVEQTLSLLQAVFRRDQITLTVEVPEGLPPIKCRSQQIQQVLMNLLTNARDALNERYPGHHADKTLHITAREVGGICDLQLPICDLKNQGTGSPIANRKSKIENSRGAGVGEEPSAGKRWIRVTVEDHGNGIPAEIRDRIFDPFFTTKPRDQGTGLGLAISHGIVKDHHGALTFETAPGTGTQFHLDLPVEEG